MNRENELLRQDLNNQEEPKEIIKLIEDAELLGHQDIVELGKQKLAELESKATEVSKTSELQTLQINELGGSNEELNERTEGIDQEVDEIKANVQKEMEGVENNQENKEEIKTLYDEALERQKDGYESFDALLNYKGEEAVEKKYKELWFHPTDPSGKKIEGLNTSKENLQDFFDDLKYINNESDLEKIYSYGYGNNTSPRYIGKLLNSILGFAYNNGFTAAYSAYKDGNDRTGFRPDVNDELKKYIDLANKMIEIDDRKNKEYQDSLTKDLAENEKKDEDRAKRWQEENKK